MTVSAEAGDNGSSTLDDQIAVLEQENAALKKTIRLEALKKENATLRARLGYAAPSEPKPKRALSSDRQSNNANTAEAFAYVPTKARPRVAEASPVVAELPYQGPPSWSGAYVGINGGWGFANLKSTLSPFGLVDFPPVEFNDWGNGGVLGGQVGYNWQFGNWVFGAEADLDAASINATQQLLPGTAFTAFAATPEAVTIHENINWLGTARARVGYASGPGMFYLTGGGAWQNATVNTMLLAKTSAPFGVANIATSTFSDNKLGGVFGAGYEWMMSPNITVRGEYLFYALARGNQASTLPMLCGAGNISCGATVALSQSYINVLRAGANYKF